MADFDLGTAHGKVVIDSDNRGLARTNAELANTKKTASVAGDGFRKLSTGMIVAGAGIAVGIGLAVKSAASFEQRLSGIKAVTGATTQQMEAVRAKALQLGKDTKFSAGEAAQAIEELSKAGISLPDILNGAADATVALAAAGEVSLPRAAEIAANAMNVFSLKAQDMPKVADLIAGAANASAISVDDFAQSLQQSGAAAALVGVSFDDLATSIALMGNAGIKGSDAGTSLKTFLQNLQPDTKKQTDLFRKLGLITKEGGNQFFDAAGNVKSMADVAQVLQDSLKGMTAQQKQAALSVLFGSDAIRAAAIISKGGADGFNKLAGAMGKVTAADVAKTRMDNLNGSIEQLKGSLETAAITLGSVVIPALRGIVDGVNAVVGAFLGLSGSTQSAIVNLAGAAAAFLLVGGAILKIISVLKAARVAFVLTWAAAGGPVTIIIAIVLALAAAVFVLYQRFQPVRTVVDAVGNALKTAFIAVLPIIQTIVVGFQNFLRVLQGTAAGGTGFVGFMGRLGAILRDVVIPALIATGQWLARTFGPVLTQVLSIVRGFVTAVVGYFRAIGPQLITVLNGYAAIIRFAFGLWLAIVVPILRFLVGFVKGTLEIMAVGIRLTLAGIANIFRGVFNIIGGIVKIFLSILTGDWRGALNGLVQIARGVWQLIKGIFQATLGNLLTIAAPILRALLSLFRGVFNAIRAVVGAVMGAARAVFSSAVNQMSGIARAGAAAIRAAFAALSALRGIVSGIMQSVQNAVASGAGRLAGLVSRGISAAVSAVAGFAGRMFAAGANIVGSLIAGLTSRLGGLLEIAGKVAGAIAKVLPGSPVREGPLKVLNNGRAGKAIIDMIAGGISARQGEARRVMSNVVGGMSDELNRLATTQSLGLMASLGVSGAASAASARGTTFGPAADTSGASAGGPNAATVDALAAAVIRGLVGAEFKVDSDGIGRIVAGSLVPAFVMGARA
jgi:TP901 family phage tail tape measure protein